ncbi:hypothetical protein POM88_005786 [Heracleum sosnowskyi]|uniref:Uncharacterized protein n=1 Tax=Heracleum sosnowskyi TaxID=360622 RepID=A0AAD8J3I3_9APIA|nr:hypothetical protein POM88_005786 [Heracleum sosnowskyi]
MRLLWLRSFRKCSSKSSSTENSSFLNLNDRRLEADQERCLSSPIFRMQGVAEANGLPQPSKQLHLSNGPNSVHDVVNSLIYVPCFELFYFVSDVVLEKNAYSEYKASRSHVQNFYGK